MYTDDDDFKAFEYDGGEKKGKYDDDTANFSVAEELKESGGFCKYEQRGCTDIPFLIVFWIGMGAMLFLGVDGLMKGNPAKLLAPLDGDDMFCGVSPGYEEYGQLFIPLKGANLLKLFESAVCVKECPKKDVASVCKVKANQTECPTPAYESADTYGVGFCLPLSKEGLPQDTKDAMDMIKNSIMSGGKGQFIIDISHAWKSVVSGCVLSFVICIAYVKLMSAVAETIAWFCVFLI